MENSNISWTNHTFNCWIGCTKVSCGCRLCYSEDKCDKRLGWVKWGEKSPRIPTKSQYRRAPHRWNKKAVASGKRPRVFCSSLSDVFDQHPSIDPAWKSELWQTMRETPGLDWLVLTKRPEHVMADLNRFSGGLPPPNVWLGFSAEDQDCFDQRWALVRDLPFRIKFVSYEPALGPVRLGPDQKGRLSWVIFGGETSRQREESRPADLDWARQTRDDCRAIGAAFWFKQTGNWIDGRWYGKSSAVFKARHDLLDGVRIQELPE